MLTIYRQNRRISYRLLLDISLVWDSWKGLFTETQYGLLLYYELLYGSIYILLSSLVEAAIVYCSIGLEWDSQMKLLTGQL